MKLLDDLLAAFVAQRRMKLPGTALIGLYINWLPEPP